MNPEKTYDAPPEEVEIDAKLLSLVVEPVNALPEAKRTVKGRVRSGEEIARAIPNVEAFLHAVSLRKDGEFFELNEAGQLVMADGCPEPYGLGENFFQAKMRQACIWYLDDRGVTQSLQGEGLYTVKEAGGKEFWVRGKIPVLELTEAAKKIDPAKITMVSGLPIGAIDTNVGVTTHGSEYVRLNKGRFEREKCIWTETDNNKLSESLAYYGGWSESSQVQRNPGTYYWVQNCWSQYAMLGSRGVLRVNLNFEEPVVQASF